ARPRSWRRARAGGRARGDVAHLRATIRSLRAKVAGLDAKRRIELTAAARAELRATLRVRRARIAGRLARRVERGALAGAALTAAALPRRPAGLPVHDARLRRAGPGYARQRATIRRRLAARARRGTIHQIRCARMRRCIAEARAAIRRCGARIT